MVQKNNANVMTKGNQKSSTLSRCKHTQKSRLTIISKHRKRKADKTAWRKRAIMNLKSNLRLNRIQEDTNGELQGEVLSNQQLLPVLAPPRSSALIYCSSDNELATALERGVLSSKGKGKAEPREGMSGDVSMFEPNYQENAMSHQPLPTQRSTSSHVQSLPPNMAQDQPSGSFFEGPTDKVEIKGGTINHTLGHHMNFTIQVNPLREEQYDMPQQYLHLPPVPLLSQTAHHDLASLPTQAIHSDQFPSMTMSEQDASTTSTTIYAPDNGNMIYERHLGLLKRGFPLWIPEPSRNLPMPYRRKGVNIGDVGILTPTGSFSFLFNICLPHDDPSNPPTLPEGFVPIDPPIHPRDIREHSEFKHESYLASAAIEKINNDPPVRGLSFATSAAECAILTLPEGAISRDAENIPRLKAYAAANIESWYRYVNGPRGREAKNGEIRLVIGCDKATSWGMAAVANMTQHKTHYLNYRPVSEGEATSAPIPLYKWDYTGLAQARVGPDLEEIEDLKRSDDSDLAVGGKYWNQCLFVRTLNLTLNNEVFDAINRDIESTLIQESQQLQNRRDFGNSPKSNSPNTGTQTGGASQQTGTNSATQRKSIQESLGSSTEKMAIENVVRERLTTSRSPSITKSHPADVLNEVLLRKVPNCRVVITQDKDWCSVINEDDQMMPSPSEIAERVLNSHHIREEDSVVFLEPKKEWQPALYHRRITSSPKSELHQLQIVKQMHQEPLAATRKQAQQYQQQLQNQSEPPQQVVTAIENIATNKGKQREANVTVLTKASTKPKNSSWAHDGPADVGVIDSMLAAQIQDSFDAPFLPTNEKRIRLVLAKSRFETTDEGNDQSEWSSAEMSADSEGMHQTQEQEKQSSPSLQIHQQWKQRYKQTEHPQVPQTIHPIHCSTPERTQHTTRPEVLIKSHVIEKTKGKALLIGIQHVQEAQACVLYPHVLKGLHHDVEDMRALLIDVYGYKQQDISVLIDDDHPSHVQPTRANILEAIDALTKDAKEHNRFFFYYAGHCGQEVNDDVEEEDGMDEFIITSDGGRIKSNELRANLAMPLPAGSSLTAVFDSCHSATLLDLKHFHCNRVYVPWINKGKRKSLWNQNEQMQAETSSAIGDSLSQFNKQVFPQALPSTNGVLAASRNSALAGHSSVLSRHKPSLSVMKDVPLSHVPWLDSPSAREKQCMSPIATYCTGFCREDDHFTYEDAVKADVKSISLSKNNQPTWDDSNGTYSMTQVLIQILGKPSPITSYIKLTYNTCITVKDPHPTYQNLLTLVSHRIHALYVDLYSRSQVYKKTVQAIHRAKTPKGKTRSGDLVELDKFQSAQLFSDRPLEMTRHFYP